MEQINHATTLNRFERALIDALGIGSAMIVMLSGIYFFYQLNAWITIPIAITAIGGWVFLSSRLKSDETEGSLSLNEADSTDRRDSSARGLARNDKKIAAMLINAAVNFILLGLFLAARTNSAIVSPWQVLPMLTFGLYFVSTAAFIVTLRQSPSDVPRSTHPRLTLLATILHFAVTWGVAVIVYQLGFGYDPFVHQATERFIDAHGFIDPKQPFYLGQYSAVLSLHHLLRIPIDLIDQWLVPLLATTVIPCVYFISKKIQSTTSQSFIGISTFLLIPFSVLTFTIPHNLSVVFLMLIILLLPVAHSTKLHWHLIALAGAALACHPLLGIPSALIVITHFFSTRWKSAWLLPFLGSIIFLPLSFAMYRYQQSGEIALSPLLSVTDAMTLLFSSPYTFTVQTPLTILYQFMHLWPVLFCIIGLLGYWKYDDQQSLTTRILLSTAFGLLLTAIWLTTYIRLANILPNEQFEFALRIIVILPLFFLPGVVLVLEHWAMHKPNSIRGRILTAIPLCGLAIIATCSWYMTYPQYNHIAQMNAPGMGQADIDAVHAIEVQANGNSYAVLSHQLMSAAALHTFGFERTINTSMGKRYPYAIPTGGELFSKYLSLWNSQDLPAWKKEAFEFIQTDQLYIAVPITWDPHNELDERIKHISVRNDLIDETIRIYKLTR